MINIPTEDQVAERWDLLTDPLKDALMLEGTSATVWKIAQAEHIPENKIPEIGMVVSHVLLGFIHPEDLPTELREDPQLNPQTIAALSAAFNQKIFAPLQLDLNKVYSPLPKAPVAPPKAGPQIISQTFNAQPNLKATTAPIRPQPPKPAQPPSTAAGWSTRGTQGPVIKFGAVASSVPPPTTAPVSPYPTKPPMQQPTPATAPTKGMSEFERLDTMRKNAATPASTPIMPPSTPTPRAPMPMQPVMLHEVSNTAAQTPDFRFTPAMQNQMSNKPSQVPMPSKPAVLEFGKSASASSSPSVNAAPSMPPTPKPPQFNAYKPNTGDPRQISELTNTPPAAQQQKGKVIVKDFLEPQK